MNLLMKRLTYLESRLISAGRMVVIEDDGSEEIRARIGRCGAEIGRSPLDVFVIRNHFPELFGPAAPGEREP